MANEPETERVARALELLAGHPLFAAPCEAGVLQRGATGGLGVGSSEALVAEEVANQHLGHPPILAGGHDAPRLAVGGSDSRTYAVAVPLTTTHLKVTLPHPSGAVVGLNGPFEYTVTVRDVAGQAVGSRPRR